MEQRNTTKNKLIYYITITLSLILILANIYFIYSNNNLEKNIKLNKSKSNESKLKYENTLSKNASLEEEIIKIKNIDEEINNKKNEYYKTLKKFEDKVINKEINYKIAYLTFDDGPYDLTHKFLEVLEKYDVRATFFTIGLNKEPCYDNKNKSCKDIYSKITKQGHTIANHTYSHSIFNGLYNNTDTFINNLKKQEELIKKETGITTNIVRFPGGISSSGNLKTNIINKLKELKYGWVDWTALNGDGGYVPNKETALNTLKNTINNDIEVILFHDYSYITLSTLPESIEYLKNENYILLPLFYESKMINK